MKDYVESILKGEGIKQYINTRTGTEREAYASFYYSVEAAISNVIVELKINNDSDKEISYYGDELKHWLCELYGALPLPDADARSFIFSVDERLRMAISSTTKILNESKT